MTSCTKFRIDPWQNFDILFHYVDKNYKIKVHRHLTRAYANLPDSRWKLVDSDYLLFDNSVESRWMWFLIYLIKVHDFGHTVNAQCATFFASQYRWGLNIQHRNSKQFEVLFSNSQKTRWPPFCSVFQWSGPLENRNFG